MSRSAELFLASIAGASLVVACAGAPLVAPAQDAGAGGVDAWADSGPPTDAAIVDAGVDADTCDADRESDPANCGACGYICAPGQSCSEGHCQCGDFTTVSFANDVQPIFSSSCTGGMCHKNGFGALGLDLGVGSAYDELVSVPSVECDEIDGRERVTPGRPAESYLVNKLLGVRLCSGSRMPGGGLPPEQIQKVIDWICAGAPND